MTPSTVFLWPVYLACLPAATAWVFSWTTPDDDFLTNRGNGIKSCTEIDNPVGNVFDWDPKGENLCINFYNNTKCADDILGYTCSPWPWSEHAATKHVRSYDVTQNDTSSSTTSTSASTSNTASAATSSSASSSATASAAAAANQDNSSSISGGAIAGIVIGVVAAVAIAALVFFFLRRRRNQSAYSPPPGPPTDPAPGSIESAVLDTKPKYSELHSPNHGFGLAEKPGDSEHVMRELSATNTVSELGAGIPRAELDGSSHGGRF
ncbi:hypothetical protein N7492_005976 [Penicillium capsulatum]|uniref:Mid2 domain-containing protein n=1 Tax=Penicillium capsulatum TaxID=69766 RepID=A0A9W9ICV4_9EURO|nr:hypothetical protein N7492_005976 [Penicillium capsulatum]